MDHQEKHHHSSGNGFMLGVIVGVLLTLLFTTKRGREILKEMTDKGIEKWSELEKLSKELQEEELSSEEVEVDPQDYVKPEEKKEIKYIASQPAVEKKEEKVVEVKAEEKPEPKAEKPVEKPAEKPKEEPVHEEKKSAEKTLTGRRWFRGLRKRP